MEDLLENVLWHLKEDRYINYRQRQNAEIGEIVFQDKKGERVSGKVGFQIFKLVGAVMIDFRTGRLSHWSMPSVKKLDELHSSTRLSML